MSMNRLTPEESKQLWPAAVQCAETIRDLIKDEVQPFLKALLQPTQYERRLALHLDKAYGLIAGLCELKSPGFFQLHHMVARAIVEHAVEFQLLLHGTGVLQEQQIIERLDIFDDFLKYHHYFRLVRACRNPESNNQPFSPEILPLNVYEEWLNRNKEPLTKIAGQWTGKSTAKPSSIKHWYPSLGSAGLAQRAREADRLHRGSRKLEAFYYEHYPVLCKYSHAEGNLHAEQWSDEWAAFSYLSITRLLDLFHEFILVPCATRFDIFTYYPELRGQIESVPERLLDIQAQQLGRIRKTALGQAP